MAIVNVALIVRAMVDVPDEAVLLADGTNETDNLLRFAAHLAVQRVTTGEAENFVTIDGAEVADAFLAKEDV